MAEVGDGAAGLAREAAQLPVDQHPAAVGDRAEELMKEGFARHGGPFGSAGGGPMLTRR